MRCLNNQKHKVIVLLMMLVLLTSCSVENVDNVPENEMNISEWSEFNFINTPDSQQGEGWKWDCETKTLTFENIDVTLEFNEENYISTMFLLPENSTLILAENTENRISVNTVPDAFMGIIQCYGDLHIKGTGELEIVGTNLMYAISSNGNMTLDNGTISVNNTKAGEYCDAVRANRYIQNGGVMKVLQAIISTRSGIEINDGCVEGEHYHNSMSVYNGDVVINGGNVATYQKGEAITPEDKGIAISEYNTDWIVNGGRIITSGILTNSTFTVNGGELFVEKVGINLNYAGRYEQNGGKVSIISNQAGIRNYVNRYEPNVQDGRIVLNGGELNITCEDEQYNAIELILEKEQNQSVSTTGIVIKENMKLRNGEWITTDITEDSEIRQRDELQDYKEGQDYVVTALRGNQVIITDSN